MEQKFSKSFRRSLHLRVIDAGACGACLSEIEQLNKPYYNMHRLGFFLTPTPREADVLLVAGPVTDHMRVPLLKAYEAMPEPKAVVALGACAIFGGIFGSGFASLGGASSLVPVDLLIPGCPPPPLAILHALLALVGRARPKMGLPADSPRGGELHV
jgi:Ni,Fe-hydrogenase III small subunit